MSAAYKLGKLTRQRSDGSKYWHWCIKWRDAEGPHRVSLGTSCPIRADAAARRFWEARSLARTDTCGSVVTAYLDGLDGLKDEKRKRQRWGNMVGFWADLTLRDINDDTCKAYAATRAGKSANTIRHELGIIKSAYKWAHGKGKVEAVPPIWMPPQPESSVSHLTKAEFRLFLDKCIMPHVRLFAILAVTTGARKSALLEAKWTQLDWDRRLLNLQGEALAVGNKGRATVPLNDRAMDALREAKEGAISEYIIEVGGGRILDVKKGIGAAAKRAGLHVTPHMFRHSAAVWMAEDRVPMSEIAAFLGHKNTIITERVYAKYSPDYLKRAAQSLSW